MTSMTETWVPASTFGSRLYEGRRVLGLTVEEAAPRCGVKVSTWSSWERGVSPHNLEEIARKIESGIGLNHVYLTSNFIPEGVQRLSREREDAGQGTFSGSDIDLLCAAIGDAVAVA